ncbi:MAG TPA: hypothetical protein VF117_06510, partial [Gammaproteobacteria bacterium]
ITNGNTMAVTISKPITTATLMPMILSGFLPGLPFFAGAAGLPVRVVLVVFAGLLGVLGILDT